MFLFVKRYRRTCNRNDVKILRADEHGGQLMPTPNFSTSAKVVLKTPMTNKPCKYFMHNILCTSMMH